MQSKSFSLSKADFQHLFVASHLRNWWKVWLGGAIFVFATDIVIRLAVFACITPTVLTESLLSAAVIGLIIWIVLFAVVLMAAATHFSQIEHLQGEEHFEWDENGIKLRFLHGVVEYPWSAIKKWTQSKHQIVVYTALNLPIVLPKRAFDDADLDDLLRQLRKNLS